MLLSRAVSTWTAVSSIPRTPSHRKLVGKTADQTAGSPVQPSLEVMVTRQPSACTGRGVHTTPRHRSSWGSAAARAPIGQTASIDEQPRDIHDRLKRDPAATRRLSELVIRWARVLLRFRDEYLGRYAD